MVIPIVSESSEIKLLHLVCKAVVLQAQASVFPTNLCINNIA
jgi:hypothetical protein